MNGQDFGTFPPLSPLRVVSQVLLAFAYPIDFDQKVLWAAQGGTRTVGWRVHDQARLLQPPHEFRQSDLGLHACRRGAQQTMDATSKPTRFCIPPPRFKATPCPCP